MKPKDMLDSELMSHLQDHFGNDPYLAEAIQRWRVAIQIALDLETELADAEIERK